MSSELRIAMWSGPRNISTALMRSFGSRADAVVVDEPFYAAYLARTGLQHPMRAEVLASQPQDWREVVTQLFGALPEGRRVQYQKHMTHHMLPEIGRTWLTECKSAFLIREPAAVLASYVQKRADVSLLDIGLPQQLEIFQQVSDKLGQPAPVIDSDDVLENPRGVLSQLCAALDLDFDEAMLQWPAGPRDTDGAWAPAWYDAVERSTGFGPPKPKPELKTASAAHSGHDPALTDALRALTEQAQPYYDALARYRIRA